MIRSRLGLMAVVAAIGLGALAPGFTQPTPIVTASIPAKRKKGLFNGKAKPVAQFTFGYPRKDRMNSAAQHKRASKKARRVAQHRGRA